MNNSSSLAVSLFNNLLGQYNGSIIGIQQGSIAIGKELFFVIATISVAVLGLNRLLSKNVDMVESNIELVKLLIYFNVFYLFIDQFPHLLGVIVSSFKQAAFYMGNLIGTNTGSQANSNFMVATNPGQILDQGVGIATTIFSLSLKKFTWTNFGMSLLAIPCGMVVLYCFAQVAIKIVIIEISSKIILSAGIFLLAFSGSAWTRDYATRYIGAFFGIGIQMLFTYLLVGIGGGLINTWQNQLSNIPAGQYIETYVAVIMAAFVYYKLCLTLPEQAAGYLSGGMTINTDKGLSAGGAVALASVAAFGVVKGMGQMAAGFQGSQKAVKAAMDHSTLDRATAPQGAKVDSPIKTLHNAASKLMQEKWDSKVNETTGGKIAQKIMGHTNKQTT
jgi:P-type conjugative transfer protein TrbL